MGNKMGMGYRMGMGNGMGMMDRGRVMYCSGLEGQGAGELHV